MNIKISNLYKEFYNNPILKNINLSIEDGEMVALLGPSGSGKTTLLKIISGIEEITKGEVIFFDANHQEYSELTGKIGFVFQHFALFNHMNVYNNISFGLNAQRYKKQLSKEYIAKKTNELLKLMQLEQFKYSYPKELSGGQKQRVALARTLATEPKILLLDEPFSALDTKIRKELRRWIKNLHKTLKITTILVTHDQEEAMEIADKIVIMNNGQIEQIGSPNEIYLNPANSFVYDFLGNFNVFHGWKDENGEISIIENYETEKNEVNVKWYKKSKLVHNLLKIFKNPDKQKITNLTRVEIFVRPHDIEILKITPNKNEGFIAKIKNINLAGPTAKIELLRGQQDFISAEISHKKLKKEELKINDEVIVSIKDYTFFE